MLYWLTSIFVLYVAGGLYATWYINEHEEMGISKAQAWNPRKWFSFATGSLLSRLLPPHIVEQLVLRVYDEECGGVCVKQGYCHDCGCAMPAKAYDPSAYCSKGNWGPMILDKKTYYNHRKQYPIKITVSYVGNNNTEDDTL